MSKLTICTFSTAAAAVAVAVACSRATPTATPRVDAGSPSPPTDLTAIDRAEDLRRADQVPAGASQHHDPRVRRRAARAFARILDADDGPLLRALVDDDDETIAWAAHGLGESCKTHEESHVRALAARIASLDPMRTPSSRVDARIAIERALGRCGGDVAEQTLRAWLQRAAAGETQEAAAYALGDIAASRGALAEETQRALLDAAERTPALVAALYPFGRAKNVARGDRGELTHRLAMAARATLAKASPERIFAIRALEQTDDEPEAEPLARVLSSNEFTAAERSEAARALAHLGAPGQAALANALTALAPAVHERLGGDDFGVALAVVQALDDAQTGAEAGLRALAYLQPSPDPPVGAARRASALRCAAAAKLARSAWEDAVLRHCDLADGEAGERARLSVLDRTQLTRQRRTAWLDLARQSAHVRVRETAIALIIRHPELGDGGRAVLAEALAASVAGVVTAAAQVVMAHPARTFTGDSSRQVDSRISAALRLAMARPWPESLIETRAALLDAGLAIGLDDARAYGEAACHDANATMRARAAKALSMAGDRTASCPAPLGAAEPAPEIGHALAHPVRVVLETDAGPLGLRFDPSLAPIAVTRLVALVRSGFYNGVGIHRVVAGFIVQLGDPDGDGYGGSGSSLRCETSPVTFGPLDVGLALAGRDTGSSQIFVTLARYPHLDGQYAWVGHAEGDWSAAVEGDVIHAARVDD